MMILLTKPCSSARLCMGNVITMDGSRSRSLERQARHSGGDIARSSIWSAKSATRAGVLRDPAFGAVPVPSGRTTTALALRVIRRWGTPKFFENANESEKKKKDQ